MKKRLYILSVFVGVVFGAFSQKLISQYEYWFDNNVTANTVTEIAPISTYQLNTTIPTTGLPTGLHSFQIRFKDTSGAWSLPTTQFFVKLPSRNNGENQIYLYEYWFDNDYAGKKVQTVTSQNELSIETSISTANLSSGLHSFQIRFQEASGKWSSAITQSFIKPKVDSGNKITSYRYWFDNNFDKQVTIPVDSVNPHNIKNVIIPVTTAKKVTPNDYEFKPFIDSLKITYKVPTLVHTQFKDKYGQWSSTSNDSVRLYYTVDVTCDTLQSKVPKIKNLPLSDEIHFYSVNVLAGDSMIFKVKVGSVIDLYDPYGKKLKTIKSTSDSTIISSRAKLDGTYYALVHGFSKTSGTYSITFTHIAKYAVLSCNVKKIGNKGKAFIMFEGNGFTKKTKIKLVKETTSIVSDSIVNNSLSILTGRFDFTGVSVGKYNVFVEFGDTTISIEKMIEVESEKKSEMKIEIIGSSNIRSGSIANYTIRCTNTGNMQIERPTIVVAVNSLDTNFNVSCNSYIDEKILKDCRGVNFDVHSLDFVESVDVFPKREINMGLNLENQIRVKNINTDVIESNKDQLANIASAELISRRCKKGIFLLPTIQAYGVVEMVVSIKTTGNSSITAWQEDFTFDDMISSINLALGVDEIEEQLMLKAKSKTFNNNCVVSSLNCLASLTSSVWGGLAKSASNIAYSTLFNNYTNVQSCMTGDQGVGQSLLMIAGGTLIGIGTILAAPEVAAGSTVVSGLIVASNIISGISTIQTCKSTVNVCSKPYNAPQVDINAVRSCDPNDKIGYLSPSGSRYYNENKINFTYVINFENKDSATAPAQEVYITDTLDMTKFNVKSLRAGYIKIGKKVIQTPFDVQNHTWIVDMRPAMNLRTEVKLTVDTIKGIARWYFKAIDPLTGELPTDALVGFLPPNDSIGSGQGCVTFTIDLKDNIQNGNSVNNRASIVFDYNDAILTPTWSNTKDVIAPVSTMSQPLIISDSIATLSWSGEDNKNGSGVYRYNLYAKKSNEAYSMLLSSTALDSVNFKFERNVDYAFYVTAIDSAGNAEIKNNMPDVTMKVTAIQGILPTKRSMNVFPNPSTNAQGVYVTFDLPNEELKHARLVISTLLGSVVKEIHLTENKIHIEDIYKGMYIFNLQVDCLSLEHRKVIIQ